MAKVEITELERQCVLDALRYPCAGGLCDLCANDRRYHNRVRPLHRNLLKHIREHHLAQYDAAIRAASQQERTGE